MFSNADSHKFRELLNYKMARIVEQSVSPEPCVAEYMSYAVDELINSTYHLELGILFDLTFNFMTKTTYEMKPWDKDSLTSTFDTIYYPNQISQSHHFESGHDIYPICFQSMKCTDIFDLSTTTYELWQDKLLHHRIVTLLHQYTMEEGADIVPSILKSIHSTTQIDMAQIVTSTFTEDSELRDFFIAQSSQIQKEVKK